MREALTLALLDVRTRVRQPGAPVWGVLALAALALALTQARAGASGVAATWFACVLAGVSLLLAAASASHLPDDRASGRAAWLASLAPAPWTRRLGAGLAGLALALAGALAAALLVGLLAPALGLSRPLRESRPVMAAVEPAHLSPATHVVHLGKPLAAPALLEVRVRRAVGAAAPRADEREATVLWASESGQGRAGVRPGGLLHVELPPGSQVVHLHLALARLGWREGRLLGAQRPWIVTWAWVGLLLGLGTGWLALLAVAVSRATTSATAALSAVVLLPLAAMRGVLPDLDALPVVSTAQQAARAVLETALVAAPDFSGLAAALDPAQGRAVTASALAGLAPLLPHAWASLALLLLPGRGREAGA